MKTQGPLEKLFFPFMSKNTLASLTVQSSLLNKKKLTPAAFAALPLPVPERNPLLFLENYSGCRKLELSALTWQTQGLLKPVQLHPNQY